MKDWAELADEYRDLELRHKEYREVGFDTQLSYYSQKYNLPTTQISDLGKMHGPAKEVYKRSDTSGM